MTTADILKWILAIGSTFFGGIGAQTVRAAWSRRAEMRKASADVDLLSATTQEKHATVTDHLLTQLAADAERNRAIIADAQVRLDTVEERAARRERDLTEQLALAHSENSRLATNLAQITTDLDIARGQIHQLRGQLYPYGPTGGI